MQKILFVLLTSLSFSVQISFSQDVKETLQFAEEQFIIGNYTNSILAYERAIYFEENTSSETYFKLANAYFSKGDIGRAIRVYDNAAFLEKDNGKRNDIIFKKCLAYLSTNQYNQAIISLGAINDFNDTEAGLKKQYFKSIAYFLKEDFDQFEVLFDEYATNLKLASNQHYIDLETYNLKADKVKPKLAMWMSVFVPGSGQILYGNWKDGLNSMALTAALVGLYFNYVTEFSLVEGYLVVLPWFQRYHKGGYLKAKETALKKQREYRGKAYGEILQLHPALF
ncbi:CDC27 family protein [Marivirga harenae]|uniref:tetratricopeptide repeat protein n=1 Tax=Marivirga harenae TaxID=2010992 RepID=UPI0026DF84EC|nr:CDC27 family protein [Marivirga harenae]WKV12555.1 CDC27 family protein [Marivirga harenae]|tara:strand:- start:41270 stop:42115 length:846 start_codon:yes stop_codon:yes gene_type:complete